MEKQNFEFGQIISKYGIVNTFPYFGVIGHRSTLPIFFQPYSWAHGPILHVFQVIAFPQNPGAVASHFN
jgi:hypothetical protein